VVFSAVEKFDGKEERPLHKSEILQIGGRAGRFGMASNHESKHYYSRNRGLIDP
jgi:ATP-dependent RNA helicase SUPV3L1/SUV3